MLSTMDRGIAEIEDYDSIEQEYICPEYKGAEIIRCVSIFGGNCKRIPHEKVLFYLADDGHILINEKAPQCIRHWYAEGMPHPPQSEEGNRQSRQRLDRHGTIVVGSCETFHHYNVQGVK